jgi:hypothetical protein
VVFEVAAEIISESAEQSNMKPSRYIAVDSNDVEKFVRENENPSTVRKTKGHVTLLHDFLRTNGENNPIQEMSPAALDSWLCKFYIGIRNKQGQEYEPSTLRGMEGSFDRHLRERDYGPGLSLITSVQFTKSRAVLKSKQKSLKAQGKGNLPNKADPITDNEIDTLFEKHQLGPYTPSSIINTLWYNNTTQFGLRGGANEHRQLCWGDIQLKSESDGGEYIELNERQTKTRTGVNIRDVRTVSPKMWALPEDPVHCPVFLYKLYANKRPAGFSAPSDPFYLATNTRNKNPGDHDTWFISQPIGVNKLCQLMPRMAKTAGLSSDKHITNHSARKYMIQKLSTCNVPPTHIMQISGHKNVQSINNYSNISMEQHQNISHILANRATNMLVPIMSSEPVNQPSPYHQYSRYQSLTAAPGPSNSAAVTRPAVLPQSQNLPSNTGSGLFRDCHIGSVTINNYNCPSTDHVQALHSLPCYRHFCRPVIDSDSDSQ